MFSLVAAFGPYDSTDLQFWRLIFFVTEFISIWMWDFSKYALRTLWRPITWKKTTNFLSFFWKNSWIINYNNFILPLISKSHSHIGTKSVTNKMRRQNPRSVELFGPKAATSEQILSLISLRSYALWGSEKIAKYGHFMRMKSDFNFD